MGVVVVVNMQSRVQAKPVAVFVATARAVVKRAKLTTSCTDVYTGTSQSEIETVQTDRRRNRSRIWSLR